MSLRFKLSLFISLLIFVILASASVLIVAVRSSEIEQNLINIDKITSEEMVPNLYNEQETYYSFEFDTFAQLVSDDLKQYPDIVHLRIMDTNGNILFDSSEITAGQYNQPSMRKVTDRYVLKTIYSQNLTQDITYYDGQKVIRVLAPYTDSYGVYRAIVEFDYSTAQIDASIIQMILYFITLLGVFWALGILSAFVFARQITKPILALSEVAKQVGQGKTNISVTIKSHDEIGELATVFNKMAAQIQGYHGELEDRVRQRTQELEKAKNELEKSLSDSKTLQQSLKEEKDRASGIVSSMGEGLIVVDKSMNVLLINSAAEKLLDISNREVLGKPIDKAVAKIYKNGQELLPQDRPAVKTLAGASITIGIDDNYSFEVISGKEFPVAITTTPLRGDRITGVVEVFRDITLEKQSREAIEQQVIERTRELSDKNAALTAAQDEINKGLSELETEKARLLASVNSITLGFLMFDPGGKILIKNPAVKKLIGIEADFADIDTLGRLLGPELGLKDKFTSCMEQKTQVEVKKVNLNDKSFNLSMSPIISTDNTLTVIGVAILIQNEDATGKELNSE